MILVPVRPSRENVISMPASVSWCSTEAESDSVDRRGLVGALGLQELRPVAVCQDADDLSECRQKIHPPNSEPMFSLVAELVRTGAATPGPLSLSTLLLRRWVDLLCEP
jgi:hypothetical protein